LLIMMLAAAVDSDIRPNKAAYRISTSKALITA
jgi:hypothetical protein